MHNAFFLLLAVRTHVLDLWPALAPALDLLLAFLLVLLVLLLAILVLLASSTLWEAFGEKVLSLSDVALAVPSSSLVSRKAASC